MRIIATALAAGLVAWPAMAEDFAGNRQKALDALMIELGVTARLVGQCERHLPAGAFESWEATTMDKTGPHASTEFAHHVRLTLRGQLHDGRKAAAREKLSEASCKRLLDNQEALIEEAGNALNIAVYREEQYGPRQ